MSEVREVYDGKVYCENCGTVHLQKYAIHDEDLEWCVWCAELQDLIEPEQADLLIEETESL